MEFHLVSQTGTTWQLQHGGNCLGIVHLTQNPFHCAHRNLTLELQDWDEIIAPAVISLLRRQCPEPLKYMVDSTEQQQIRFLRAGGFRLARRCFVREFPRHQCKSPPAARLSLSRTHRGQPHWERCGALLLQKYIRQHESISPLTATRTQFFEALPETVLYFESSGEIRHFAFVEDNEIAYLWSADAESRPLFLE